MNVKSKYDEGDAAKEPGKKKYMFLGYGNSSYSGGPQRRGGFAGSAVPGLHVFDIILEKLGIKKKVRRRSEGEE